jgi:hypothetical protein
MKFINEELFPLAKFLVINQCRKFGITLANVIIANEPNTTKAGYYDPEKKDICLNIGVLDNPEIILRFQIPELTEETRQEHLTRVGAAILFEECYHAAHYGTELNTEELATKYGTIQASKLPTGVLANKEVKVDTEELQEKVILPLTQGGMVNFINEISKKGDMNTVIPTRYGSMEVINNDHTTMVKHTTNVEMLDEVKKTLGHIIRVGIEYAGMIYVHENESWKTFVDVDNARMAETEIKRPTEIHLTKIEGQDPVIELRR